MTPRYRHPVCECFTGPPIHHGRQWRRYTDTDDGLELDPLERAIGPGAGEVLARETRIDAQWWAMVTAGKWPANRDTEGADEWQSKPTQPALTGFIAPTRHAYERPAPDAALLRRLPTTGKP